MKRPWAIYLVLALLLVGGIVLWRYVVPLRKVSDLYRHYERADGIAASYIHNYRVNDTLTLDVTLLEATTDSGWARLQRDFLIPRIEDMDAPDSIKAIFLNDNNPNISFWNYPEGHPELPMDTVDRDRNDVLYLDSRSRVISLFHTRQYSDHDAVIDVKMNKFFEQAEAKGAKEQEKE